MRLGRCEWRHQILFGESDAAIQSLFTPVDPGQHEGCGQDLERAAHGKALVGAVADQPASRDIQ
jgi:hypothetical protein